MKSAALAWLVFCVVLFVPTGTLAILGLYAGDAESARVQGNFFARRVETTKDVRQQIELAVYHAAESLRALPNDAPFELAVNELRLTAIPFASAYAAKRGVVVDVVFPAEGGSAADERVRASTQSFLKSGDPGAKFITGVFVQVTGRPLTEFTRLIDRVVVFRSFSDVTVGWIFDIESLRRGAEAAIGSDFAFEPTPPDEPLVSAPFAPVGYRPAPSASADSFYITRQPGKVTVGATTEDQTKVIVDPAAKNLVFRIVPKDPTAIGRSAFRARLWIVGWTFACLVFFVGTATVLFKRLRSARHLADLRTDFVAAVSHELRTPLASVRMFAELLEAGDVPEDERAEVEQALAGETRRLHATLDRMLRYGALARGKLVVAKRTQMLRPIVEAAKGKRDVTIDVDSALDANVDEGMLSLALDNLLSNAAKYAPEGGPYLVRARTEGADVLLSVSDQGPGLSKEALKKVFAPFERADQRLSKATEGTGVGLALVRGIARAHGGDATVTSDLGHGACFTLRLPRA